MIHHHLEICESTQEVLKQYFKKSPGPLLISTSEQTHGRGRMGHQWMGLENALTFSFSLDSHPTHPTLTSLEVGLALARVLERLYKIEIRLKWPNDIINQKGRKVGGILLQSLHGTLYACGIGINWSDPKKQLSVIERGDGQYPAGALFSQKTLNSKTKKEFSFTLASAILAEIKIIRNENFAAAWNKHCLHLKQQVQIKDSDFLKEGIFIGIGEMGEALLQENSGKINRVFSGSLLTTTPSKYS